MSRAERAGDVGRESLGLFVLLAVIYGTFRSPSYGPGDSAQHLLSCMTWGVSRPPGYPLYTAVGHLFGRLGGIGAVSLFSGLAQAAAGAGLHYVLRRQGAGIAASAAAASLLWLSPLQWYYAMIPEVRGLNHAAAAGAAAAAVCWAARVPRSEYLFGIFLGAGLSHHPTFLFIVPAVLLFASSRVPTRPEAARAFGAAAASLALPYVLLWGRLRWGAAPLYNFDDVRGAAGVAALFFRKGTGGLLRVAGGDASGFSLKAFGLQLGWYLRTLSHGLTPAGLLLAAVGVFALRERRRELGAWLTWALLPVVVYAALAAGQMRVEDADYAYAIAARFHLLPMMGVAALAAHGASLLASKIRPGLVAALALAGVVGALMRPVDLRAHEPTRAYARDLLAATKDGDVLVLDSDDAYSALTYEGTAGGAGDRVLLLPSLLAYPPYRQRLPRDLRIPEGATDWSLWLQRNPRRDFFAEGTLRPQMERDLPTAYPDGPLIRLSLKAGKAPEDGARRFLASSLGRLSRNRLVEHTQEISLARSGAALAHWHLGRLQAVKRPSEDLQAALGMRLESFW